MDKDSASREQCQIYLAIAETQPIFCKDTNKPSGMPNLFEHFQGASIFNKAKATKSRAISGPFEIFSPKIFANRLFCCTFVNP